MPWFIHSCQWYTGKLASWKQNKTVVCSIYWFLWWISQKKFQANKSLTIYSTPLHFIPLPVFAELPPGVMHAALLLHIHFPPSPIWQVLNGHIFAFCGAQPMRTTNRTSECKKRVRLGSDPPVSLWPDYPGCLHPGYGSSLAAFPM